MTLSRRSNNAGWDFLAAARLENIADDLLVDHNRLQRAVSFRGFPLGFNRQRCLRR
jgi:hypothetical protein